MAPLQTKQALREILNTKGRVGWNALDEVYPGIYIGGEEAARNVDKLKRLGITHVLNASFAAGSNTALGVSTDGEFYRQHGLNWQFLGVPALDFPGFNLSTFFEESVQFIDKAMQSNGRILVHCFMGVSRSATLVLAYLMTKRGMTAPDALKEVRTKRNVFPNDGFLDQLCELEKRLRR